MSTYFATQSAFALLLQWLPALLLVTVLAGCQDAPPTPLAAAAAADDTGEIRTLLAQQPPNALELQIALGWAARSGATLAARALLDAGAPIDGDDGRPAKGWTALLNAVHHGRWDTARELLAWGADPNLAARDGLTPLIMVCDESDDGGHVRMVEYLLLAGADPHLATENGATALSCAVAGGNARIITRLLVAAPDLTLPDGFAGKVAGLVSSLRDEEHLLEGSDARSGDAGWPPLLRTLRDGTREEAFAALAGGADARATAPNGRTSLMVAAARGDLPLVRALLEAGVDPRAEEADHLTALGHAVAGGNADVVRAVLEAAPGLKLRPILEDEGALFAARLHHRDDIVAALAERDALP
jgi:ankyrin repeat protein